MYGCGALVWSQNECNYLNVKQHDMERWLWDVVNVKNELIRGENGWSYFNERENQRRWQVGCCEECLVQV